MAKGFFRTAVFALLFAGLAAGVSAQITVSGGLALSSIKDVKLSGQGIDVEADVGFGGNIYLDYLLPISIPLSLGFEAGVDSGSFTFSGSGANYEDKIMAIPLLLRLAYHFDFFPKFDLYVVGKVGFAFGIWTGDQRDLIDNWGGTVDTISGLAYGFDAGVAYYFSANFGIFAEAGFDNYMLKSKIKTSYTGYTGYTDTYETYSYSETLEAPFNRFVTLGISTRF
jgi:hypothetical protein